LLELLEAPGANERQLARFDCLGFDRRHPDRGYHLFRA
jgi:hypothetical protein